MIIQLLSVEICNIQCEEPAMMNVRALLCVPRASKEDKGEQIRNYCRNYVQELLLAKRLSCITVGDVFSGASTTG